MYWAVFSRITSQPASTTSTVVKVVRMISGMEIPSTPR